MGADDDIARLLPEPPPPRPARREAAIAAALRRFDGVAEPPAATAAPGAAQPHRPGRARIGRGQIGAFASILLVALLSIPVALLIPGRQPVAPVRQPGAPAVDRPATPGPGRSVAPPPQATGGQIACGAGGCGSGTSGRAEANAVAPAAAKAAENGVGRVSSADKDGAREFESDFRVADAPPAPPPPAPPPPEGKLAEAAPPTPSAGSEDALARNRAARGDLRAAQSASAAEEDGGENIIVTGARTTRPRAAYRRGDWNACTVNDPEQSLKGCKSLVNPGAKGAAGAAAARVADGLALAWRGDLDGAIGAFDEAIVLQPRLAFAYLNRGLAHQRNGEPERAAADLDRAVRYAPSAARGYYNRSLVRRERGDKNGARADEERAASLDARYQAVVE